MNYSGLVTDDHRDGLYGVYVGVVSDIEDPENMGRVKVTFPWRDADDESKWARIATPMAGKDMGAYFLPEKDDEVLVAFGDGDIHDPYVVGSLWNGKQSPPQKNDKKNPVRQIKSRAGHTITLDDTDDKGNVEVKTAAGQHVVVDDKNEKIELKDKAGNTVVLSKDGISLDTDKTLSLSGKSVELKGKKGVKISGQQISASAKSKAEISSKGQLALKTKGKADLQAKGMLNVKTSGILKMKGSMIMLN
jgi:uncharacterized protein involved in type VI secretion and phage assembly